MNSIQESSLKWRYRHNYVSLLGNAAAVYNHNSSYVKMYIWYKSQLSWCANLFAEVSCLFPLCWFFFSLLEWKKTKANWCGPHSVSTLSCCSNDEFVPLDLLMRNLIKSVGLAICSSSVWNLVSSLGHHLLPGWWWNFHPMLIHKQMSCVSHHAMRMRCR